MILLDASIFIDYLRSRDPALALQLDQLQPFICGITRAEILHGARDEPDYEKLVTLLNQFPATAIPQSYWDKIGFRLFQLRSKGILVPFQDAALATIALELDAEIWSTDKHFPLMATVLPLRLYAPPIAT